MKILSCDLETTGLRPSQDDWITGSFAILDYDSLEVIKEIDLESRPMTWNQEAFEIHKIREETAMNFPERKETLQALIDFIPKEPFYFLCHAKPQQRDGSFYHFDFAFLKMDFVYQYDIHTFYQYFNSDNILSTYTIGKRLSKEGKLPLKSMGLASLCDHFSIKFSHHNARSDRIAMEKVLRKFRVIETTRTSLI